MLPIWEEIVFKLENMLSSEDFSTWILPLHVEQIVNKKLILKAANKYLKLTIEERFSDKINQAISGVASDVVNGFKVEVKETKPEFEKNKTPTAKNPKPKLTSHLNDLYTFENFVIGQSNELALAASKQIIDNPGRGYNPMFIYGATGLGKTHLIHAIGHKLLAQNKKRVLYVRSELFSRDMITAIKNNTIDKFKSYYQSLDALLMDDVQFLADKVRTQEEFFHSFNFLLETNSQVVVTCDKYPRDVDGLMPRLTSRFGSGVTIYIDPPDYETRVGILMSKAKAAGFLLPEKTAFFIAKIVKSNVRELEGALNNVCAMANLTKNDLSVELAQNALKDLISAQNRSISIDNIQKTVADYFGIRIKDLLSKGRSRSIVRPRQIAMALTKELTNKSLPEIGDAFGGRDHTTVIHSCKKVSELKKVESDFNEDYINLLRQLSA